MTTDELERIIYARFAAPYGPYMTPGLRQQLRICARQAVRDVQATMQAERVDAERARRDHVRELATLPLRERLRTSVRDEAAG